MATSICRHVTKFIPKFPLQYSVKSVHSGAVKKKLPRTIQRDGKLAASQMLVRMEEIHRTHQEEAERSVIIHSYLPFQNALDICSRYGQVNDIFFFNGFHKQESLLVVYDEKQSVDHLLGETGHNTRYYHTPVRTRFLLLNRRVKKSHARNYNTKLHHEDPFCEEALLKRLSACNSISEQMVLMHKGLELTETGLRLRYLICQVIKESMQSIVRGVDVLPFGSTVNGFGRHDADVDMCMLFPDQTQVKAAGNGLEFMYKVGLDDKRKEVQQNLETVRCVLKHFLPQFHNVLAILKARIPIIRFQNAITCLECDLSMCNESAIHMSELLHVFSKLDASVQPLVYTIRQWARKCEITRSDMPGAAFTNFMLTLMVIHFLQTRPVPILPSVNTLRSLADENDVKRIGDLDCTFTSDWKKVPRHKNRETLGDLLREFFSYYYSFDFENNALSLVEGQTFEKPALIVPEKAPHGVHGEDQVAAPSNDSTAENNGHDSPAENNGPDSPAENNGHDSPAENDIDISVPDINNCYIENPLERELNVCRNVSKSRVLHFREECHKALETLKGPNASLLPLLNESHENVRINLTNLFEKDR